MNFTATRKTDLTPFLPKGLNDSLLCLTSVNHQDEGPDFATCHANGFLYEIQNKKLIQSLKITDKATSISCYYLLENEKVVLFYLVYTSSYNLLVIRKTSKILQVVKTYEGVSQYQVYDYECLGFPQIKIMHFNNSISEIYKFPVGPCRKTKCSESSKPTVESLSEKVQILYKHIDDLWEEHHQLRSICFINNSPTEHRKISLGTIKFSSSLNQTTSQKWRICDKWHKIFGSSLILGLKFQNISNEVIHNFGDLYQFIIRHGEVKDYSYNFFRVSFDSSHDLFSLEDIIGVVNPCEIVCAVGAFKLPAFVVESQLSISCWVTSSDLKDSIVKDTFKINLWDVAKKNNGELLLRFTVEDFLAIKASKFESRIRIQTEDLEDDFMETVISKFLDFKRIKHVKDKLFYCTSTYLKEVFVAVKHVAANPSVWIMLLYTSDQSQIYFFVNAVYDHLPENTSILCEEI